MSEAVGVISALKKQDGFGKRGKWEKLSICMDDEWYGAFINDDNREVCESISQGDEVAIEWAANGKFKNFTQISLLSKSAKPAAQEGVSQDVQINMNQFRGAHAGGTNRAIEIVKACLAFDATQADAKDRILALPTKKADRLEAIVSLVKTLGNEFAMDNWNVTPDSVENDGDYEE